MNYKQAIQAAITEIGQDPLFRVLGYNTSKHGGYGAGGFSGIEDNKITECPLQEHTMTGVAVGMSLAGLLPVCWYERADFLTNGMDPIVNHLDKIAMLSDGIHNPACIIRVCVGNRYKPLFTEPTHVQNFSRAFRELVSFPVIELHWIKSISIEYRKAMHRMKIERKSTMLVEFKDEYDSTE